MGGLQRVALSDNESEILAVVFPEDLHYVEVVVVEGLEVQPLLA